MAALAPDGSGVGPAWHAQPPEAVLRAHDTHHDGLTAQEARRRLARHGPNRLAEAPAVHRLRRQARQFHNLLIYVLLAAAFVTALMSHWVDTGVILAVVIINAGIGFFQEGKAERALQAIRHMLSPRAVVVRDGDAHDVDAAELVPGDVVLLASGDRLPADVRLLQARNLRIDEALLTGESVPVDKRVDPVEPQAAVGDRFNMGYAGTLVTQGQARAVVVATGSRTEISRIGRMLETVETTTTPLLRRMAAFGRWLTLAILGLAGALCNDASLRREPGEWRLAGDPTEGALLTLAMKAGLDLGGLRQQHPRLDAIPFESEHRYMATLHPDDAGGRFVVVKGAPERVLAMCSHEAGAQATPQPLDATWWQARIDEQAREGRRVLALAWRALPAAHGRLEVADVEQGLTLLGLVAIIDPPREEAIAAVAQCLQAGIRVKMITGDHGVTASAIAGQLGLGDGLVAMTGPEIEALDDEALREAVRRTDVFARASPEHKLRLVRAALQANGEIVAMTGDGVNDAPALKQADVGVAMGRKGTEAAKQAGAMVLADDNFVSIVHAVEEGRTVYDNLRKTVTFLLPINGGESLTLLVAVLLGVSLPILPAQILWVNMVSSIALAMVLAFEPREADVMRRPPRAPDEPLLSRFVVWRIALVSTLFLTGIFGMYEGALAQGHGVETARTVAVNTLVVMEVFYLFSVRYLKAPSFTWQGVQGTPRVLMAVGGVVLLQMAFTYAPWMQALFQTEGLSVIQGLQVIGAGVAVLMLLELEKLAVRRLKPA